MTTEETAVKLTDVAQSLRIIATELETIAMEVLNGRRSTAEFLIACNLTYVQGNMDTLIRLKEALKGHR